MHGLRNSSSCCRDSESLIKSNRVVSENKHLSCGVLVNVILSDGGGRSSVAPFVLAGHANIGEVPLYSA